MQKGILKNKVIAKTRAKFLSALTKSECNTLCINEQFVAGDGNFTKPCSKTDFFNNPIC